MRRIVLITFWMMFGGMFAAQIVYGIVDVVLDCVKSHQIAVHVIRECLPLLFIIAPLLTLALAARGFLLGTDLSGSDTPRAFWICAGILSVMIHAIYCIQAFLPLREGGMASEGPWLLVFYPQCMFDFFLPPDYPIQYDARNTMHISYFHFWGKMMVAFPASLAEALLLVGGASSLMSFYKRKNKPFDQQNG